MTLRIVSIKEPYLNICTQNVNKVRFKGCPVNVRIRENAILFIWKKRSYLYIYNSTVIKSPKDFQRKFFNLRVADVITFEVRFQRN